MNSKRPKGYFVLAKYPQANQPHDNFSKHLSSSEFNFRSMELVGIDRWAF